MSNRLQQIKDTAPRVVASLATPGYWRPAGNRNQSPTEGVVIALADFAWLAESEGRLEDAIGRIADLEVAIQRVLETTDGTDEELSQALRTLRAVWARA